MTGVLLAITSTYVAVTAKLVSEVAARREIERRLRPQVGQVMAKLSRSDVPLDEVDRERFYAEFRKEVQGVIVTYFDNLSLTEYVQNESIRQSVNEDVVVARRLVANQPSDDSAD